MHLEQQEKHTTFLSLVALWAMVESGLGGMMHAFHLPFTGIVLGGFSILILSLIAQTQKAVFGQLLKATLIVIAVKASVNPLTSPMAYLAVSFQGLAAALLFSVSLNSRIVFLLFGAITMAESAVQKFLVLTLIFGNSWWKAINAWFESITQIFGISPQTPGSIYVIGGYLFFFVLWGLILGNWMYYLPGQLKEREGRYSHIIPEVPEQKPQKSGKKTAGIFLLTLFFVLSSFWLGIGKGALSAFLLLGRTLAVLLIWMYILLPVWKKIMQKWLTQQHQKQQEISLILSYIPHISQYVNPLFRYVSAHHKGMDKWKEFILGLIVISLHRKQNEI